MARSLADVANCFFAMSQRIDSTWPSYLPAGQTIKSQVGWSEPALTFENASTLAGDIGQRILDLSGGADPNAQSAPPYLEKIAGQAEAETNNFNNLSSGPSSVARATFEFLNFVHTQLPPRKADVDWDRATDQNLVPKRLGARLRALEARLTDLEPRSKLVDAKISSIEKAHDAAERLPTDLEELRIARDEIGKMLESTRLNAFQIDADRKSAESKCKETVDHEKAAFLLVQRCEEAYRITTSAGLAGAFEHRSRTLAKTGWAWVFILISSLIVAGYLGVDRLNGFKSLLSGDHSTALVSLNLLIAVVGVAAPVWLAWLATRNIGQSFKLSEDYAFKSAVSKAYEGYRKEAVSLDENFAKRLFGSALDRLDESPSRFIVRDDFNSPLEALLSNTNVKEILSGFPELHQKLATLLVEQKALMTGVVSGSSASLVSAAVGKKNKPQVGEDSEVE